MSLATVIDLNWTHWVEGLEGATFDWIMRHRLHVAKPDPQIVPVNIDERSLADMAPHNGRYPWNRGVFAEFVEKIEEQKPLAIVFDIVFSDPDIAYSDLDDYFNEVIKRYDNIYLGMIRLEATNDRFSHLHASQIASIQRPPKDQSKGPTLALVIPSFPAALNKPMLGFINTVPEDDGVVRSYLLEENKEGWVIPSLGLLVAQKLQWSLPQSQSFTINWRGPAGTLGGLSFSEVYLDLMRNQRQRPRDEFTGKVVVVGSSAPALSDFIATPMSPVYPGFEVLVTALDNLKQGDWLRRIDIPWLQAALTFLLIGLTAFSFYTNPDSWLPESVFGLGGTALLGLTAITLNLSDLYIDLTMPFSFATIFFTVAASYRWLEFWSSEEFLWTSLKELPQDNTYYLITFIISAEDPQALAHRLSARLQKERFLCVAFPDKPAIFEHLQGDLILLTYISRPINLKENRRLQEVEEQNKARDILYSALKFEDRERLQSLKISRSAMWLDNIQHTEEYREQIKENWQKVVAKAICAIREEPVTIQHFYTLGKAE